MIGAIKRRWKSKKAKVLHKGSELSTSTDSCPTSRGFATGCEEFEKILKPPSPRQIQIHPVIEKSEVAINPKPPQPPKHFRKKCSTLPPASEAPGPGSHPFIRVNSGRIELVNKEPSPLLCMGRGRVELVTAGNEMTTVEKLRRLGGRLRNDTRRSSWCGSAFRDGHGHKGRTNTNGGIPALVLLEEQVGRRGPVAIPMSEHDSPVSKSRAGKSEAQAQTDEMELKVHRLLEERLSVLEGLTGTLKTWQKEERFEYEKCMSELATQVSRAVALQQLMKTEVEKLQARVVDLETTNKAMTTMIVPTLMKLQTTIGKDSTNPQTKKESTGTFLDCRREFVPGRLTQSLERKENQKRSVKSPKQRKIDCRIPRINSVGVSRTNPPKQATELEKKTKIQQVESSKFSTGGITATTRDDGIQHEVSLSSPTSSSKSESSSSTPLPQSKSKGVRGTSSSYSGIPRMSSPRPPQPGKRVGNGPPCKEPNFVVKNKKNEPDNNRQIGASSSRLPVRRNLFSNISTSAEKGNVNSKDSGQRTTTSLTFLKQSPSKLTPNSSGMVKSAGNCAGIQAGIPKAGKDEGYSTMSSEALAEQENAEKCQSQIPNFSMHKSNTFNTFLKCDNYGGAGTSDGDTRSPKRINFTSLPTGSGLKTVSSGPRTTVRIIRGITSYDMEMDGEETTEDPSTSTILWEDSDDSDILFLPLEMSSEVSSSRSTLVPSSSSFISPNGLPPTSRNSFSTGNEKESTYPSRRSRGEELVALLAAHRGRGGEAEADEMEERALIEKWMRLEDVRNEVQWDDEWAWDWDGVARTHKLSRVLPPPTTGENDESEFWFTEKSPMRKTLDFENGATTTTMAPTATTPIQIDTSTWTKSKKKQALCEEKLQGSSSEADLESNSPESQLEKVLDGDGGHNGLENENGLLINAESCTGAPGVDDGSPPPVIEFTPEYYHLVNYGSNLSVSDNENSPSDGRRGAGKAGLRSAKWISGRTDDKVSQTDFSSSLENLSVSSELFTECRNCLELIKKLVGTGGEEGGISSQSVTTLDRHRIHEREEQETDLGSPTAWISVPKGQATTEVREILEILSSSESEDVLSPSK